MPEAEWKYARVQQSKHQSVLHMEHRRGGQTGEAHTAVGWVFLRGCNMSTIERLCAQSSTANCLTAHRGGMEMTACM